MRNDQKVPYLPATRVDGGRRPGKSSLCSSGGDLTGCLLQAPAWQQLVLEQQRRLHQAGHLGEALIKESWSTGRIEGLRSRSSPRCDESLFLLLQLSLGTLEPLGPLPLPAGRKFQLCSSSHFHHFHFHLHPPTGALARTSQPLQLGDPFGQTTTKTAVAASITVVTKIANTCRRVTNMPGILVILYV